MGWLPQVCQTCLFDNSDYKSIRTSGAPHGARRIQLARLAPPIPHKGGGRQNRTSFWVLAPPMPWDPLLVGLVLLLVGLVLLLVGLVLLLVGLVLFARRIDPPARRIDPPARRIGPFARRIGPPARRIGPHARRIGPPARRIGPPARRIGSWLVGLVFGTLKNHCFDTFVPRTPLLVGLVPMLVGLVMCSSD